jgi:hypothetical protein
MTFALSAVASRLAGRAPLATLPFGRLARVGLVLLLTAIPQTVFCLENTKTNGNNNNGNGNGPSNFKEWLDMLIKNSPKKSKEEIYSSFQEVLEKEWTEGSLSSVKKAVDEGTPTQVRRRTHHFNGDCVMAHTNPVCVCCLRRLATGT